MKKFQVVKQRDFKDCGPACILSILKYYGGYVPLEKIRSDCFTDNSGTTAFHMVNTLTKYGFDSYGAKIAFDKLNEKNLVLPVIAHLCLENGLNHYVVIYKITKKFVIVMDPSKGIVKFELEKFKKVFTNVIIVCYLKSTYIANYKKNSLVKSITKIIKSEKSLVIKIMLFGLFNVIFTIITGFYFKVCFNNVDDNKLLKILFIIFFFCYFTKIFLELLSTYLKNYLIKNIDFNVNNNFFDKLFNLPSRVLKSRNVGEIITRVTELNNLHEFVSDIVVTLFINSLLVIMTFVVLYFINSKLLLILIIFLILFVGICLVTNKMIYNMIKENIESNESFSSDVIEKCNAFDTIKNNSLENYAKLKINNSLISYLKTNFDITKRLNIINTLKNAIIDFMYYTIITVGIIEFLHNNLSLVDFITFESVLVYLVEPLKNIMNLFPKFNYLKASFEKILEFNSLEGEVLDESTKFLNGDIIVKNMSYSYNDYNKTLNNVNLIIPKYSKVMIKGKSGTGKSTFCKLLNRTYEYDNGSICIGGINIKDYPLKTVRNNILYLSQNEFLFNDTIKNNILLNKKYDVEKFDKIAKICCLDEIVSKKPLRYETYIDKDFSNLSGGEKQRIILARALYRNFKILILDEALSEVNIELERNIIGNLKNELRNRTLIYVTHKEHESMFEKCLKIGD
ncbi:MAG: peptidase domain-containing ABC transporter [Firmicutes bacterium]|nr:peptidase domain-containing ABC transporter [Bacillota bacterium]